MKAQISLDLMLAFSIILILLIVSPLLLKPFSRSFEEEARRLCGELSSMINLAILAGNRFHSTFKLPNELVGKKYNVTFLGGSNVLLVEGNGVEIVCFVNSRSLVGGELIAPSLLSITNLNESIYITALFSGSIYYRSQDLKSRNLSFYGIGFSKNGFVNFSIYNTSNILLISREVQCDESGKFQIEVNGSGFSPGKYTAISWDKNIFSLSNEPLLISYLDFFVE